MKYAVCYEKSGDLVLSAKCRSFGAETPLRSVCAKSSRHFERIDCTCRPCAGTRPARLRPPDETLHITQDDRHLFPEATSAVIDVCLNFRE